MQSHASGILSVTMQMLAATFVQMRLFEALVKAEFAHHAPEVQANIQPRFCTCSAK
jgi:hypothetical protein